MSNGASNQNQLSIVPVAAAAASGLGILGFVTFAGGVVLWRRFGEMGLPATNAVAAVPSSLLVSTGAEFLVPALLITTGFVVLLLSIQAIVLRPAVKDTVASSVGTLLPAKKWFIGFAGGLVVVTELTLAIFAFAAGLSLVQFLLLAGLAIAGGFVVGLTVWLPVGPATLGLVAFLAVGTFWIARAVENISADKLKVVPLAYSREQPGVTPRIEWGYLVAETNDRIIFASQPVGSGNELREFPRSESDDLEIGSPTSTRAAKLIASQFAYNMCNRVDALTPAHGGTPSTVPCGLAYLVELAGDAGLQSPALPRLKTCTEDSNVIRCIVDYPYATTLSGTVSMVMTQKRRQLQFKSTLLSSRRAVLQARGQALGVWKARITLTQGGSQYPSTLIGRFPLNGSITATPPTKQPQGDYTTGKHDGQSGTASISLMRRRANGGKAAKDSSFAHGAARFRWMRYSSLRRRSDAQ